MIPEQFYIKEVDRDFMMVTLQFTDGNKMKAFLELFKENYEQYRLLKEKCNR